MKTDLDALERVVREMTAGEWADIPNPLWSGACHRIAKSGEEPWANFGQIAYAPGNNAAGIVALHTAAESLIGELRAARAVVEAGRRWFRLMEGNEDPTSPTCLAAMEAFIDALAAYQTGMEEGK